MEIIRYSKYIDHSLLHPTASLYQVEQLCREALLWNVAAVCVKPDSVSLASSILRGAGVGVATVISFPHGSQTVAVKCFETEDCLLHGATEIDMVVNISQVLAANWNYVKHEISQVFSLCKAHGALLKVIFETAYISEIQIATLCEICSELNVNFVKTSTGFDFVKTEQGTYTTVGAKLSDVMLMRDKCESHVQIKASGGIRSVDDFLHFIHAGATRIGTSATREILQGLADRGLFAGSM